jgi:hypothetical protein
MDQWLGRLGKGLEFPVFWQCKPDTTWWQFKIHHGAGIDFYSAQRKKCSQVNRYNLKYIMEASPP